MNWIHSSLAKKNYHCDGNHFRINAGKVQICICNKKICPAKPKSVSVFKNNSGRLEICICNARSTRVVVCVQHEQDNTGCDAINACMTSATLFWLDTDGFQG